MYDPAREMLEKIKEEFLKYCHHENCLFPEQCPKRHPKCKEKLGLDTAVAWRAAQNIIFLLSEERTSYRTIQTYLTHINELYAVITLHSEEFPKLYRLLDMADCWINILKAKVDDY